MQVQRGLSSKLFSRYSDKDAFTKSFSKFLFVISAFFFMLMSVLFLINLRKHGFIFSFATSGTSCISAMIAMFLIVKGEPRKAGILLVIFQTCIIFLGGFMRSPELNLMTIAYFGFPTILLAVVFTNRWIHISITVILAAGLLGNLAKFSEAAVTISPETVRDMVTRGTVVSIATFMLLYSIAVVTVRSLNLSLKISRDEKSASDDKNKYIMELIETIRRSYDELTGAMGVTGEAMNGIFANIQTEAATIEELVASIEEISSTTTSVENATKDQNDSVNELSSSINSLSSLIDSLTVFGNDLQKEFGAITRMAEQGRSASGELEEVNSKTLVNSDNMQSITGIIDDFFDRINLLSLNASIEAARAGEHGRGFAVVADEIGKLADNSSSELKKIKDLIETSRADVAFSSTIIGKIISFIESLDGSLARVQGKAMETLGVISNQKNVQGEMIGRNRSVFEKSEFIKDASAEQSIAIQEIAKSIENTNMLVQENTRNAESLNEGYVKMKRIADDLKRIMNENS